MSIDSDGRRCDDGMERSIPWVFAPGFVVRRDRTPPYAVPLEVSKSAALPGPCHGCPRRVSGDWHGESLWMRPDKVISGGCLGTRLFEVAAILFQHRIVRGEIHVFLRRPRPVPCPYRQAPWSPRHSSRGASTACRAIHSAPWRTGCCRIRRSRTGCPRGRGNRGTVRATL